MILNKYIDRQMYVIFQLVKLLFQRNKFHFNYQMVMSFANKIITSACHRIICIFAMKVSR